MAYTATNSPSTVNTIALSEVMTGELDKALMQGAVTDMFEDSKFKVKFVGNKTVIVPEINMSAMGDYDRDDGFASGSVTVSHTPHVLQMDRGRSFQVDAQDMDEAGIGELAGVMMDEFVRTKAVPEVDAYCLSKLAGAANTQSHVEALATAISANTILGKINTAMIEVQDVCGFDEDLVCFIDKIVYQQLQTTTELTRQLALTDFKKGEVTTKVTSYNGVPLIPVPSPRMKSAYTFYDGTTPASEGVTSQVAGGFVPAPSAKNVGFIILPKRAAALVKKTAKVRIFDPLKNLNADAWKFDYRLYYDLMVRNSYKDTIRALTYTPAT